MSRHHKRWIGAGLVVIVAGAGALAWRQHRDQQARGPAVPTSHGLAASAAPLPIPETPEAIAAEVASALASWREAILVRDADTVVRLDRMFVSSPDRYRAALVESARGDRDERVRAFSTRVLGKLQSPALADQFEALLADKSPFVRQNAAWALGELAVDVNGRTAARRAVAELRQARARDPAPDVRTAASGALARLE